MIAKKPILSVIVPNFNHSAFLQQRLESVFNQSFQDYEVILLDDASTDRSPEILERYASHPKVSHFIVNKRNSSSPFKQWEKGINLATGEYIWIAESDDFCETSFLEQLLPLFQKNINLVYSASNIVSEEGEIIGLDPWAAGGINRRWTGNYTNSGKEEIKIFLRYINTIPNASAVLFRKSALSQIKIPVEMQFCGDWHFWIEILNKGDLAFCSTPLNYFRKHDNTTRTLGDFQLEHKRMKEYFHVITKNSNFFDRIRNKNKYVWLVNELWRKRISFPEHSVLEIKMPLDFWFRIMKRTLFFYLDGFKKNLRKKIRPK